LVRGLARESDYSGGIFDWRQAIYLYPTHLPNPFLDSKSFFYQHLKMNPFISLAILLVLENNNNNHNSELTNKKERKANKQNKLDDNLWSSLIVRLVTQRKTKYCLLIVNALNNNQNLA